MLTQGLDPNRPVPSQIAIFPLSDPRIYSIKKGLFQALITFSDLRENCQAAIWKRNTYLDDRLINCYASAQLVSNDFLACLNCLSVNLIFDFIAPDNCQKSFFGFTLLLITKDFLI